MEPPETDVFGGSFFAFFSKFLHLPCKKNINDTIIICDVFYKKIAFDFLSFLHRFSFLGSPCGYGKILPAPGWFGFVFRHDHGTLEHGP